MAELPDLDAVRRVLAELWPDCGPLQHLPGEHDLNLADDQRVYKIMAPDADEQAIHLQISVLEHLQHSPVATPRMAATENGHDTASVALGGQTRTVWAIDKLPGGPLARTTPWQPTLIRSIGSELAMLHIALADFEHPGLDRNLRWRIDAAPQIAAQSEHLDTHPKVEIIRSILLQHTQPMLQSLERLPQQALHYDLNDHNLLCQVGQGETPQLTGLIDFGDMLRGACIADIAIAAAYLVANAERPLRHLRALIAGYASHRPLSHQELALFWPLLLTRMAMSMIIAWEDACDGNDDPYRQVSQQSIVGFLDRSLHWAPNEILRHLCAAAGLEDPARDALSWIAAPPLAPQPVFTAALDAAPVLDLSITGEHATDNPVRPDLEQIAGHIGALAPDGGPVLGRYREPRLVYGAPFYLAGRHGATERRTVHIAIDVFLPAGTPVHAPYDGEIFSAEVRDEQYDYGGLIVLRHAPEPGIEFYTLYGHLQHASVDRWQPGDRIEAGSAFASLGTPVENGGWPPHVHFQVSTTPAVGADWPGVVNVDDLEYWERRFPDPSRLLGLSDDRALGDIAESDDDDLLQRRQQHAPHNLRLSYSRDPLDIVRGWQSLLFDRAGRSYLDAYNNVPHVGHSHPAVREAVDRQLRWVNTNTRYLQPIHSDYCEALAARLPASLNRVFLLSSGSEANELAVRLARSATDGRDMIALKAGYHGHTVTAIELSDYKANGPGGDGTPEWVHLIDNPDTFAGPFRGADAAARYAQQVRPIIEKVADKKRTIAGIIAETFPSVGGQVIPPDGYLKSVYREIRAAGGLCIADEVQTGLGRLGEYFWGFEQQGVVPDIVVLGKPLGNGYPLAAVITTDAIAEAFDSGMEFFATFGGSSVACAAGLAVLDVIERESLAAHAAQTGNHLRRGLESLAQQYPLLADVRGLGLFLGVAVTDTQRQPLPQQASYIVQRLREQRVLIGIDGPHHNVLKIRPPLSFTTDDANHLLDTLAVILGESALQ